MLFHGTTVFKSGWYLLKIDITEDIKQKLLELLTAEYGADNYELSTDIHVSIIKDELSSRRHKKFGTTFINDKVTLELSPQC